MTLVQAVGNPYESMRDVVARLGIQSESKVGFEKQFGITLNARIAIPVGPHLLMADAANLSDKSTASSGPALSAMQDLLSLAQAELNLQTGDYTMLIPDMPAAAVQAPPIVMIAQVNQAQKSIKQSERVLGVCKVIINHKV